MPRQHEDHVDDNNGGYPLLHLHHLVPLSDGLLGAKKEGNPMAERER
jgi:hypothetical protein